MAPIGMTTTGAGAGGHVGQQHGEALDAGGPADGGGGRAAHFLDQPVIAAAGHHSTLRAEAGGDEFEGGVAVVVEAADDARVLAERHAEAFEQAFDVGIELRGRCGEGGGDGGGGRR